MKRLLSVLLILTVTAVAQHRANAQDDMQSAPPPPQGYNGPGPDDQGPPPDQGGPDQGAPDQGAPDQGDSDQGDDSGVSYQTFYDNLSDQGTWVQTDDYGYAFQPTVSDPNWAPYTDGHWVYTDVGWTWVSDEPWGWATYHYGRWVNIDGTGWCWVPGYRWAPAWVSWRYGGGYCGWAPLPPTTFIGVEFGGGGGAFGGFHFGGDIDVNFGIGAGCYNFVEIGHMGDPNVGPVIVNRYNNFTIINRTTNITNINVNRGSGASGFAGVKVGGPPLDEINAHSQHQIQQMRLAQAGGPGRASERGGAVAFYAPRVNAASMHQARPGAVSRNIGHTAINRGYSISRPLAVNASVRPAPPSPQDIQKAKLAQSQAPASAKVGANSSQIKVQSSRITGMAPTMQSHTKIGTTSNFRPQTVNHPGYQHTQTAPTYHPQTENNGGVRNTEANPAYRSETPQTYHPQTEGNGTVRSNEGSQNNRPETSQTYRPQQAEGAGETRQTEERSSDTRPQEGNPGYTPHTSAPSTEQHQTVQHAVTPATPHPQAVQPKPAASPGKKDDKKQ